VSEIRVDPITGRAVVIAEGRAARPNEYARSPAISPAESCPFCPGHESWTPPEVAVDRPAGLPANGPGWTVRAIPNKFPTVEPAAILSGHGGEPAGGARRAGRGVHEVIVETPDHDSQLSKCDREQSRRVFRILADRVRVTEERPEVASFVLFENSGPESGGTLYHPHAQIVGVAEVLPTLAEEMAGVFQFRRGHGGTCPYEAVLDEERRVAVRRVAEVDGLTAYCPYASEHPYSVRILPHRHVGSLAELTASERDALADLLVEVLRTFEVIVPSASYNFIALSYAARDPARHEHHWHLDLLPRLVRPDGFELGGGMFVNPVPPETAAQEFRAAFGGRTSS
jgi:UDPglucose--hexose-1-phosphate uridylyltransferase